MVHQKWRNLQLFAGESDSGDTAADAGQQNGKNPERAENAQDAAAKSFRDMLEDPQCNAEIQAIIRARLKGQKDAEAQLSKVTPVVEALARRLGQDPQNPDYETLARAVSGQEEKQFFARHIRDLEQQGDAMKAVYPGFDLRTELQNPVFSRMTSPQVGIRVEDAYYAVHRRELQTAAMEVAAHTAARKISGAIAAGTLRPQEAGQSGQGATLTHFDYRSASREQKEALRKRIREAAARGEKVYP